MNKNFADRLIKSIDFKKNPCVVGLDPRIELIPDFILNKYNNLSVNEKIISVLTDFNIRILDIVMNLVPVIKPQIAFYEQYGIPGLIAFQNTIEEAKKRNLIVIVDAKRNDIGSTAEAYANAFLGKSNIFGDKRTIFNVDALTINPFLGIETIVPFIEVCKEFGKGIFVLVKTSNPGSCDIQDKVIKDNEKKIYSELAETINKLGQEVVGREDYSSIGAVVGATYPETALELREIMNNNFFLVPGYGAQGASGKDILNCFNKDKKGAIINSSRNITFSGYHKTVNEIEFSDVIYNNTNKMVNDINSGVNNKS